MSEQMKYDELETGGAPQAAAEASPPWAKSHGFVWSSVRRRKERRVLKWLLRICVLIACAALFFKWNAISNQRIDVTTYRIFSDRIDEPVRAAFLADLHQWSFGEQNEELVQRVVEQEPDLILIGGDMLNDEEPDIDLVLNLCDRLVEIAPVYYCMGNHENVVVYGMNLHKEELEAAGVPEGGTEDFSELIQDSALFDGLEARGVTLLQNSSAQVEVNGNALSIGGISTNVDGFWPYSGRFFTRFESKNGDAFKILISHYPTTVSQLIHDDNDIDLLLSGHTHGGVVRIPGVGGLMVYDEGFPSDNDGGEQSIGNIPFIVSRGLGNHGAIPRIFNRPELVVIDLF